MANGTEERIERLLSRTKTIIETISLSKQNREIVYSGQGNVTKDAKNP